MSERLEVARSVVGDILGCPVAFAADPSAFFAGFEASHCFDPALQPALTAGSLGDLTAELDRRVVHELHDPLGTRVTLFWLGDTLVVIGPYVGRPLEPGEAEKVLGRLGIPARHVHAYTLYRARFALLDSEYVMRAAVSLLGLVGVPASEIGFARVAGTEASGAADGGDPLHSASYRAIEARYAVERDFMQAVADGDERRALAELQRLSDVPRPPGYLNTPYLGGTILRIMSRVAAQQGGLPAVTIDAISQTYAQRLHRSGLTPDPNQTLSAAATMVSDFCRQVRRYRQRPYSRLVRQVVDEIELHLSRDASPAEMAERLHVSASHLARRFKAETGHTIAEHVAAERAARAAHLLATTDQPVKDIAAHVGYLDANYFVKVFRSVHGMTPTAYRREHAL